LVRSSTGTRARMKSSPTSRNSRPTRSAAVSWWDVVRTSTESGRFQMLMHALQVGWRGHRHAPSRTSARDCRNSRLRPRARTDRACGERGRAGDEPCWTMALGPHPEEQSMASLDRYVRGWPEQSREAAQLVADKYGEPQESTPTQLTWHKAGPWKRIVATREYFPHDFPVPHIDAVESFIDYRVP